MNESVNKNSPSFRLCSLTLWKHPVLGDLHLDFCHDYTDPLKVYSTIIIGINGIGKSYLLRTVADIFRCLEQLHEGNKAIDLDYYFDVKYNLQGRLMEFANFIDFKSKDGRGGYYSTYAFVNNGQTVTAKEMILPNRVLACSTTINDKFLARSTVMYRYKGVRSEGGSNMGGTGVMVRTAIEGLLNSFDSKAGFHQELRDLLCHLNLQPRIELSFSRFRIPISKFAREDMTDDLLFSLAKSEEERLGSYNFNSRLYRKITQSDREDLTIVADFFKRLTGRGFDNRKQVLQYRILEDDYSFVEDRKALILLLSWGFFIAPSLKVFKNANAYEFEKSSSGESNLLYQMINIMSDIQSDSLILIDEPENSSHPNWQINYMSWLKTIFERYFSCHFVISTHSHFMLTDLEPETSSIIVLKKKDGAIKDVSDGVNTFSWSVDDILYRVFGVRNTRNRAFEDEIMELYQMMSEGSKDIARIKRMIEKLSSVVLPGNDPLLVILDQARKYVENR